jgi:hypothetical protein
VSTVLSRAVRPLGVVVAVSAVVTAPALPAAASSGTSRASGGPTRTVGPAQLPGVPAAALLATGRVLVLRPHRLELAVDGHIERRIPVRQPLDLARLPDVVGDPAVAVRSAPGVVRLRAVLLQRPGTVLEGGATGPLTVELDDSGGAGPARISGTRATLRLRHVTVTALPGLPLPPAPVAAGLRYLHRSDLTLQHVTLRGLGTAGAGGVAAVRSDGESRLRLADVTLVGGGRGVRVDEPAALDVEGLQVHGAPVALDVGGAHSVRLSGVRVDAATDALVLKGSQDVVVRGSELRASRDAVRVTDSRGVILDAVATSGAVRGTVTRGRAGRAVDGAEAVSRAPGTPGRSWSPWSPVRGAGAVALLVLAGGIVLELGRSWRRRSYPSG